MIKPQVIAAVCFLPFSGAAFAQSQPTPAPPPVTTVEGVVVTGSGKRCDQADAKQRIDCVIVMMKAHKKCEENDTACIETVGQILKALDPRKFETWCYNQAMRPMQMAMSSFGGNDPSVSGPPEAPNVSRQPTSTQRVCSSKPN